MSDSELLRYRNFGRQSLLEVRQALAHYGLKLRSDARPFDASNQDELGSLLGEQVALKARLREIDLRIRQLKLLKKQKPTVSPAVFARWLELKDYSVVAREFSIKPGQVSSIVSSA